MDLFFLCVVAAAALLLQAAAAAAAAPPLCMHGDVMLLTLELIVGFAVNCVKHSV